MRINAGAYGGCTVGHSTSGQINFTTTGDPEHTTVGIGCAANNRTAIHIQCTANRTHSALAGCLGSSIGGSQCAAIEVDRSTGFDIERTTGPGIVGTALTLNGATTYRVIDIQHRVGLCFILAYLENTGRRGKRMTCQIKTNNTLCFKNQLLIPVHVTGQIIVGRR